jgi:hypothetical protein
VQAALDGQFQGLARYATLIIRAGGVADARKTPSLPSHRRLATAALSAARMHDPLELPV